MTWITAEITTEFYLRFPDKSDIFVRHWRRWRGRRGENGGKIAPGHFASKKMLAEQDKSPEKFLFLLQMDYVDAYENVTLDSVSALKFVNSFPFKNNLDFVLLGDDDTYINIPGSLQKRN